VNLGRPLSALSPTTETSYRTRWNRHTQRSMNVSSASIHHIFAIWTGYVAPWC
jgi:hypothetical protein